MRLKRLLSGILACNLMLTFLIPSYADGTIGSSAGQNTANIGAATSSSGNGTWNLNTKTGFRFTICDAQGNPVSNIAGGGIGSLDVIQPGVRLDIGEIWTACATQQQPGINSGYINFMDMSTFLNAIGEPDHDFRWTRDGYALLGDQVKEFILKGATLAVNNTETAVDSDAASQTKQVKEQFQAYYDFLDLALSQLKTGLTKEATKDIVDNLSAVRGTFKSAVDEYITPEVYGETGNGKGYGNAQWQVVGDWNDKANQIEAKVKETYPELLASTEVQSDGHYFGFVYAEFQAISQARNEYNSTHTKTSSVDFNKLNPFNQFSLTAYASPSSDSGEGTSASNTATTNVQVTESSVLALIINLAINDTYVFQLDGSKKNKSDADGKLPTQVFTEKGYVLLVEATIQGCPQGWNVNTKSPGVSYKSEVYGTAHNWLVGFGNSSSFKNSGAFSNSFGNHKKALAQTLPNAMITKSNWIYMNNDTVLLMPSHGDLWTISDATAHMNEGFGCHIYTALDLGEVPNIITTGNPSSSTTITKKGGEDFILNRFFRKKNKDNSYTYESYDSHMYSIGDKQTVEISGSASNYSLVEWGTSEKEFYVPSKLETWEKVKVHNDGSEGGSATKTLEILKGSSIKTINVLYEKVPTTHVIKVYEEDGETKRIDGPTEISETPYIIPDEDDGYTYIENKKSPDSPKSISTWSESSGSSGTESKIDLTDEIQTIYILYQKSNVEQIKLYSNELSFTYDLRDLVKSRILFSIYDTVPSDGLSDPSCSGHGKKNRKCTKYAHKLVSPNNYWSVKVANSYDYDSGTTFIKSYENTGNLGNRWIANVSGVSVSASSSQVAKPNGTFLLYRQKDKDLVTLYPEKNNSVLSKLNGLGITSVSYTPAGTRAEKEMQKDSYFTNHFQTYFDYTEHHTSLFATWYRSKCNKDNDTWYDSITITSPDEANVYYSGASGNTQNVKEWYYVGESNSGLAEAEDSWNNSVDSFYKVYTRNRKSTQTSSELKFYPYAKMIYRDKNANSNKQDVYVTSENLSTMKVFNAIQVGVYKKNEINANLTSTQWSTHARSLSFLQNKGISDKKSVLPGGAIQDIDMGSAGDTKLGVKIWQSCLPDEQVKAVQDGFKVSESEARDAADELKSEIEVTLSGYGLVQYGISGVSLDYKSVLKSGEELHENSKVSFVSGNNGKTSSDSKYYLRQDGTGSNRANFDVLDSRIDKQVLYTIKSDTDGNVMLYRDGVEIAKISKTQSASDMLSKSGEIQLLDANTKLVTNYISAIDRNKGESNKYDRYNQNKYNEAFDGVSVLMTDMSFDIGFGSGNAHRTNVLDPLLTAKTESKSDLYNFTEDSKIRSSVYVTTSVSSTSSTSESGYIGTLSGVSGMGDLKAYIGDIQSMVYTKNFYIPNANVSDLN